MKTTKLYFKSYILTYFIKHEGKDAVLGFLFIPIFIIGIPLIILKDLLNKLIPDLENEFYNTNKEKIDNKDIYNVE